MKIIGIAASLRKASYNRALLNALAQSVPDGLAIEIADISGLPLYDGDLEATAFPATVTALKEQVAASDGLLICSPEYNGSLPAVGKNAIDWLSRPPQDQMRVIRGKPVALAGTTPGMTGTAFVQVAWQIVFRALGMPMYPALMMVPNAMQAFDANGTLTDEGAKKRLAPFMSGFADFASKFAR